MVTVLAVIAAILGGLRIMGVKSILFQGIAHVFVGGLLGAGIKNKIANKLPWKTAVKDPSMIIGLGLTILEVICFLASKLS